MGNLSGKRVVITRAAHQAGDFAEMLRAQGADPVFLPVLAILPPEDPGPLRRAAAGADAFDWIVFTSANAVDAFANELTIAPAKLRARIAVVGAKTRDSAQARGLRTEVIPEHFSAESLSEAFGRFDLRNAKVLFPASAIANDALAVELGALGARVEVVQAYRNTTPPDAGLLAAEVLREPFPDWVTFASPSAVEHLVQLVRSEIIAASWIASIGSTTSGAIRRCGLRVDVEADPHTTQGLVSAMASFNSNDEQIA